MQLRRGGRSTMRRTTEMYFCLMQCCGVVELHNLREHYLNSRVPGVSARPDPKAALQCLGIYATEWQKATRCDAPKRFIYAIFTGTAFTDYAPAFKDFITAEKLGSVMETQARLNTNSGNSIKCYLWTLNNYSDLVKWWTDHPADPAFIAQWQPLMERYARDSV
jgi:hypothetical protein